MSEVPPSPEAAEESPGVRLVQLMWCGGHGRMWEAVKKDFSQMWGMGRPEDERQVAELLQAGAKAVRGGALPGRFDRKTTRLSSKELADHWSGSIDAAVAAGRFTTKDLESFLRGFRSAARIGGELLSVHTEAWELNARRNALTREIQRIREDNLAKGREMDRAMRASFTEHMNERQDAVADENRRRSEAGQEFTKARSEAKNAANRTAVAERRFAGGRGTEEELAQARAEQRQADLRHEEAEAERDRVDAEIRAARRQRRDGVDPRAEANRQNRLRAEEFEAKAKPEIAGIDERYKVLEAWHGELRKTVDVLEAHYLGLWHEERQRRRDELTEERERARAERDRLLAEQYDRERDTALGDPNASAPAPPETEGAEPGTDGTEAETDAALHRLRERYSPETSTGSERERPAAQPFGFSIPPVQDGAEEPEEEVGSEEAGEALVPPPIGFSFPPQNT